MNSIDNDKLWDKLYKNSKDFSEADLRSIFEEAKNMLCDTIKINELFRTRALTILSFLIPTSLAIVGFLISLGPPIQVAFFVPIGCGLAMLLSASYYCLKIINSKSSYFTGNKPSNLLEYKWNNTDTVFKDILFSQCQSYHERIDSRIVENNISGKWLKDAVTLMFLSPILSLTVFILFLFIA